LNYRKDKQLDKAEGTVALTLETAPSEQERSAEIESIRAALGEGESSGKPRPFAPEAFKKRMLTTHG
jgi:Arc/MetJ-type ribon-helix-helix transcriptional regulator